ncbi:hypothetical protein INT45_000380 [Circinella minor]|uniref:CCHC-type domain-containing protein n=1 Tax=Circinella minor TaxID=1195481 RepID=A0A8H7VJX8_9FUNG|nr:hypothetical protein INT45_000380 [Circinella minor]
MDIINIQLTSNTTTQQPNVDNTIFKRHDDNNQQIYNKTTASLVVTSNAGHQQVEQQQYEEDCSSSSSSTSLVSWTTTAEQDNKKIIIEESELISSSSASSNADDNDKKENTEMSPSMTITTVTECIPNVWQPTTTSKKQILDYRENSGDNNNNSNIPHHQYHSPQEQQPLIMNSEERKSINSTTVESLAVTENHHEESTTGGQMMQFNSQQKRISKRVHRSSDHHKRAAIPNQNRKLHANNINKANNNATLPTATNNTANEKSPSSLPLTTITKSSGKQEEEVEDRVVRSDEIALFMRCKKRYSDPDFKPIPPLPGGWDEVTPDRVISWEQTAEMLDDFSSYKQNDPDWKNKLPWARHHRHHHHREKDTNKKPTSSSLTLSSSSGITDNVVTVSSKSNKVKVTAEANKAMINNSNNTRYHDKNDVFSNSIKSITRQNDVPWTPVPGQIDYHSYYYKQQHLHSLPPPIQPSYYRFLTQPGLLSRTPPSSQPLFEQKTPSLWDISNSHHLNNSNTNNYNNSCPPSYNNSNFNNSTNNNGRRSSTFSLDIQTGNQQAYPSAAMRRLSYGYDNKYSLYQQENHQRSQQRNNDSSSVSGCSPWSPTLSDWSSKYRAPVPTSLRQQEWTPPVSPWSVDNSKRNGSFSNISPETLPSTTAANNSNSNTWEEQFASILKVVDDDTATKSTVTTPFYHYQQQQQQQQDIWPLSPPSSAGGIIDHQPYQHCNNGSFPTKRRSSYNDAYYHYNHYQQQQPQRQPQSQTLWNNNNSNGDTTKKATASTSEAGGLLITNSQLLQNMAQTGHIGCRHCGSATHSTSKECPHIPLINDQDAWIRLLQAGHRCDTMQFMEAIDIYSKSQPSETFSMIARRLQDSGSKLQLVALEKPLLSTTILVDLQGIMHRKYTVTIMVFPQPPPTLLDTHNNNDYYGNAGVDYNNSQVTTGVPESAEQNIARLTEAGFARDLTEVTCCMLCKQSGHWAKDCYASQKKAHYPPPPPLLTLSMPSPQRRRPFNTHRQQSTPDIFSRAAMNSSTATATTALSNNNVEALPSLNRGRFNSLPSTDNLFNSNGMNHIAETQPTTPSSTRNKTKSFAFPISRDTEDHTTRRLYYSLNEYVLVDGI